MHSLHTYIIGLNSTDKAVFECVFVGNISATISLIIIAGEPKDSLYVRSFVRKILAVFFFIRSETVLLT